MIHNISRFIAALALILLTAQTAGAQTVSNVPYIDADGNEQTATYATVVTSDMGGTSADNFSSGNGWYYVNSDVTLNGAYNTSTYTQNIILGDGATLTVSGLFRFQNASLNIYCQSGGTGRLVVSGSYGSNAIFSVTSGGTLTINGGTVEVTNTAAPLRSLAIKASLVTPSPAALPSTAAPSPPPAAVGWASATKR